MIEATLGVPQLLKNHDRKSTTGLQYVIYWLNQ